MIASCQKDEFKVSTKTEKFFHVKNGNFLIPVLIRGNTESKKIIIFIQGGPASNSLDFAFVDYPNWRNTLEKDYAVAYYEQRGNGNSQGDFSLGENITATYTEDLHKVASFLAKAYHAEITMLGHSYGGDLMFEYMIRYGNSGIPKRYIAADAPATSDAELDTLRWKFRWEFLQNIAKLEISNGTKVKEWNEVLDWLRITPQIKVGGTDPYKHMKQWNTYVQDLIYPKFPEKSPSNKDYLNVIFFSAYNPFPAFLSGKEREKLENQLFKEEFETFKKGNELMNRLSEINNQSILLLTGRYDDVCPPEELTYIFDKIRSHQKQIKIINNANHQIFIDQPSEFFNAVKSFIH